MIPERRTIVELGGKILTSCGRRHGIEGWDSLLPSVHVLSGNSGASEFDRDIIIANSSALTESAFHDTGRNILI